MNKRIVLASLPSVTLGLLNDLYLEPLSRYGFFWFRAADFGQFVVVHPSLQQGLLKIEVPRPILAEELIAEGTPRPCNPSISQPSPAVVRVKPRS